MSSLVRFLNYHMTQSILNQLNITNWSPSPISQSAFCNQLNVSLDAEDVRTLVQSALALFSVVLEV